MAEVSLTDISMDYSKLKVPDLKKELKLRGLSTAGNKSELIERLQTEVKSNDNIGTESVDDLDEDLLNDDDDEHLDANESVILDNDLDDSPKGEKRKLEEHSDEIEPKKVCETSKKVILNRNLHISSDLFKPSTEKQPENDVKSTEEKVGDKKIIKLSQLNAKERLEMRAKKFGVTAISTDAKKAVRAERFGNASTNSASSITSTKVVTSVDVLKQRAERFGGSVSTVMSSLENKEKLEKRKARFGITSTINGAVDNDKAKARLERFKQPVK